MHIPFAPCLYKTTHPTHHMKTSPPSQQSVAIDMRSPNSATKGNEDNIKSSAKISTEGVSSDVPTHDFEIVADKWQGTTADKHDMLMLGRSQVLRVIILKPFPPECSID